MMHWECPQLRKCDGATCSLSKAPTHGPTLLPIIARGVRSVPHHHWLRLVAKVGPCTVVSRVRNGDEETRRAPIRECGSCPLPSVAWSEVFPKSKAYSFFP